MALLLLNPKRRFRDPEVAVVGFYPVGCISETESIWEQPYRALHFTFDVTVQLIRAPNEIMNLKTMI